MNHNQVTYSTDCKVYEVWCFVQLEGISQLKCQIYIDIDIDRSYTYSVLMHFHVFSYNRFITFSLFFSSLQPLPPILP